MNLFFNCLLSSQYLLCFILLSAGICLLTYRDGPATMLMFTALTVSSRYEFTVDNAGSLENEVGIWTQFQSQDCNCHMYLGTIVLQDNSNFWAKQQSECFYAYTSQLSKTSLTYLYLLHNLSISSQTQQLRQGMLSRQQQKTIR